MFCAALWAMKENNDDDEAHHDEETHNSLP